MSLFLNPKHVTMKQYPTMSLHEKFATEFLHHRGNFLGLTYLKVGPKVKGVFVLQFQKPPEPSDLQDGFCFSYKLIRIKNKPLFQINIHVNQHLFQSFLLLEHPLIKSVLHTITETQEIFFLIFHKGGTLSVHELLLASSENDELERKLGSIRQDLSLLMTGEPLIKSILKPYKKNLPCLMKLICAKDVCHLNLKEPRLTLENPSENSHKAG